MVSTPPRHRTRARAIDDRKVIDDVRTALCLATRTAVPRIFSVSSSKFPSITSSIRRDLMLRIPVIPSLKLPVIRELISRTCRLPLTIFF